MALAEAGGLERLFTDFYAGPVLRGGTSWLPKRLQEKVHSRFVAGIPDQRITCLWGTTALEHLRHRVGCSPSVTYAKLDQNFSRAAERCARGTRANLFLYSPYAWEAFTAQYSHYPRRVLFQYHPHPDFERAILGADYARFPYVAESYAEACGVKLEEPLLRRERDCWRHADLIICASGFTRQSLVEMGADERVCRVVPYGIDLPVDWRPTAPNAFNTVFVGSGVQRKGLHHLLMAWSSAKLPADSRLTLVCRSIDSELERRAAAVEGVILKRGVPAPQLQDLYAESTLFVMPSLVEGFGQVYLEALAQGCPVLGTSSTCLPD